eukprot:8467495-Alexandrium_andersonii.AAC.1
MAQRSAEHHWHKLKADHGFWSTLKARGSNSGRAIELMASVISDVDAATLGQFKCTDIRHTGQTCKVAPAASTGGRGKRAHHM